MAVPCNGQLLQANETSTQQQLHTILAVQVTIEKHLADMLGCQTKQFEAVVSLLEGRKAAPSGTPSTPSRVAPTPATQTTNQVHQCLQSGGTFVTCKSIQAMETTASTISTTRFVSAFRKKKNEEAQARLHSLAKEIESTNSSHTPRWGKGRASKPHDDKQVFGPKRVISHPATDSACALVILANSVLTGIQVQHNVTHENPTVWMLFAGFAMNVFFFFELVARLYVARVKFFTGPDHGWNSFDFFLVILSAFDIIPGAQSGPGSSSIKIIKMLRIVRIFRVFRFFKELSLLALMIADSVKSLVWALFMLSIIIYVFAVCFTSQATDYIKTNAAPIPEVQEYFGSLSRSVYILVQSMLAGVSWGVVSDVLLEVDAVLSTLFFGYVAFTMLAVLNIITGVFVDNAVVCAKSQRDYLITKEKDLQEQYMKELRELFHQIDADNSSDITWEELQHALEDDQISGYFATLGLAKESMRTAFDLVDTDGSGQVEVNEFLSGCMRLKGEARSVDLFAVLGECRKTERRHAEMMAELNLLSIKQATSHFPLRSRLIQANESHDCEIGTSPRLTNGQVVPEESPNYAIEDSVQVGEMGIEESPQLSI